MPDDVPQVRLVRKDLGDLAFWAPLVGLTMEREPEVEQYLRNLVVGRGRTERILGHCNTPGQRLLAAV